MSSVRAQVLQPGGDGQGERHEFLRGQHQHPGPRLAAAAEGRGQGAGDPRRLVRIGTPATPKRALRIGGTTPWRSSSWIRPGPGSAAAAGAGCR